MDIKRLVSSVDGLNSVSTAKKMDFFDKGN